MKKPFMHHVLQSYQAERQIPRLTVEVQEFLEYLLSCQLISEPGMKQFALRHELEAKLASGFYPNKTQAVQAMAHHYAISESSLWNFLK